MLGGTLIQVAILTLPPETLLWQAGLLFAAELALGLGLIAAAFIDLSHMYLPDSLTLGGALLGVLTGLPLRAGASWQESLLGGRCWFCHRLGYRSIFLHRLLRGKPGMGPG